MKEITDEQWMQVQLLLPEHRSKKGGRPRASDRKVLNGILWVMSTGSKWSHLPKKYGAYVTCWRRFKEWEEDGTWTRIWLKLLEEMDRREQLEWVMALLEGSFVPGKRASGRGAAE